jgi:hypothetical protein
MTTGRTEGEDGAPAIACDLGVTAGAAQARRWLRLGRTAGLGQAETEDGVLIRFRDEPAAERELRALAAAESGCCPWARWQVRRGGGELILDVRSTPEGATALHEMFRAGQGRADAPG